MRNLKFVTRTKDRPQSLHIFHGCPNYVLLCISFVWPHVLLFFLLQVYDSSLIRVSDIRNGVVAQPSQFRVDASQAGEGQLEISINDGEVINNQCHVIRLYNDVFIL